MRLFLLFLLITPLSVLAQSRGANQVDATLAGASYRGSISASFQRSWHLGAKRKFGIGVGARATSFFGANQYYLTAPAELTSGSMSPLVLFKMNIEENIDSLLIQSPQVNMVNLMVNLDYHLSEKMEIGFNIDITGFSFGGEKPANFISGPTGQMTTAKPTPYNILLISDNDRGSLNSEFYLKYTWKPKWAVKAAAQFLFTEYTTETKVQQYPEENDRFRNKSLMASLGVSHTF